jgi:hypothetical protein
VDFSGDLQDLLKMALAVVGAFVVVVVSEVWSVVAPEVVEPA